MRHLLIAWLVVVLAIATFETGRHSAHHIDDEDLAACLIASAATHVPAAEAPPAIPTPVPDVVRFFPIDVAPSNPSTRPLRVDQGRAPPLQPSV